MPKFHQVTYRKAKLKDIKHIYKLINSYARKDLMLPRSLNEIYENTRDFWVCVYKNSICACCALHVSWDNLAEIKSLAVKSIYQKKGVARELIKKSLQEARELGINNIFTLTYAPLFFKKFGFRKIAKERLPHKIWYECVRCPKFPDCGEVALIKKL